MVPPARPSASSSPVHVRAGLRCVRVANNSCGQHAVSEWMALHHDGTCRSEHRVTDVVIVPVRRRGSIDVSCQRGLLNLVEHAGQLASYKRPNGLHHLVQRDAARDQVSLCLLVLK